MSLWLYYIGICYQVSQTITFSIKKVEHQEVWLKFFRVYDHFQLLPVELYVPRADIRMEPDNVSLQFLERL